VRAQGLFQYLGLIMPGFFFEGDYSDVKYDETLGLKEALDIYVETIGKNVDLDDGSDEIKLNDVKEEMEIKRKLRESKVEGEKEQLKKELLDKQIRKLGTYALSIKRRRRKIGRRIPSWMKGYGDFMKNVKKDTEDRTLSVDDGRVKIGNGYAPLRKNKKPKTREGKRKLRETEEGCVTIKDILMKEEESRRRIELGLVARHGERKKWKENVRDLALSYRLLPNFGLFLNWRFPLGTKRELDATVNTIMYMRESAAHTYFELSTLKAFYKEG
jgi:hypothetical protein